MLSILIPIYNTYISTLVKELHDQCTRINIEFEIICFDDDSESKYKEKNREVGYTLHVSYIELSENHGRSKIRNMLAKNSRYAHLLFLDSDSKVKSRKFIKNYVSLLGKYSVISGGRKYNPTSPKNQNKILHWKYGSSRECPPLRKRNRKSYQYFHSNNFLIDKDIFIKIQFDTTIEEYGYEDLVFGKTLKDGGFNIHHIDNPVIHKKLKPFEAFMHSIDLASENLANLYYEDKIDSTRLLQTYRFLAHREWLRYVLKYIKRNESKIMNNLKSQNPRLRYLDMYKLSKFHEYYDRLMTEG